MPDIAALFCMNIMSTHCWADRNKAMIIAREKNIP
jgi:hypothetical protein